MRRLIFALGVGVLALTLFSFASPASAIDDIVIPIDTVVRGEEGEVVQVASVPVDAELVGDTCNARLVDSNNESTHPNNDLIFTSGSWTETVADVESVADSSTEIDGTITLGETVVIEVRLGGDGVFSGGLTLNFDCEEEVAPTSIVVPTTAPPTTEAPAQLPQTAVQAATAAQPTFTG